jgi:hypothetical protein
MAKDKDDDALIEEALDHLQDAERDRAKARGLRAEADALDANADAEALQAERDLEKAKGNDGDDEDDDDVTVRFRHLAEHEKAKFKVDEDVTLEAIWNQAYREFDPELERGERDVLQAPQASGTPVSLMEHLGLTLKQARHRDLCDRDFEIAARTGGA